HWDIVSALIELTGICANFPSCPGKRRIGRWGESGSAILRSSVKPTRTFSRTQALQFDNVWIIRIDMHNLPPGPGKRWFGRGGKTDSAIVRSAIQPSRSLQLPQAFE